MHVPWVFIQVVKVTDCLHKSVHVLSRNPVFTEVPDCD